MVRLKADYVMKRLCDLRDLRVDRRRGVIAAWRTKKKGGEISLAAPVLTSNL